MHMQSQSYVASLSTYDRTCSLTCYPTQVNAPRLGWYSIFQPPTDGKLRWPRWLVVYGVWLTSHQTVTHSSSYRVRCRAIALFKTNVL